ncbi:hypothetical protein Tco_1136141 [Tanacetum coccineum]
MSTSNTHQQSLDDAGSKTSPSMLERGSYIPWVSRFRRYLNQKRENRKWLNKVIDEGPYEFRIFTPSETEAPRMQKEEDLRGDDLKHYEAEIEAMSLILISIPNDIYNFVDACTTAKVMWQRVKRLMRGTMQNKVDRETRFNNEFNQFVAEPEEALVSVYNLFAQLMNDLERNGIIFPKVTINTKFLNCLQPEWLKAKKLEKSHDPLALVAHTGSSSRTATAYYVTHPSSLVDYDDDYQGDVVQNNSEDLLTSEMILLTRAITHHFFNLKNNRLCTSSNTRNQAIIQGDKVNIQSKNSGNDERNIRQSYVQEEIIEGNMLVTYRELFKLRLQELQQMFNATTVVRKDEAGVILTDKQNDFHFADASRIEETEELSANICLMARIQPENFDSDEGPSYDSAFLSKVQAPSTSYVNPLFAKDAQEQKYPNQPKIINNTIGDDQINSNIIFDEPNGDVNSGSVEYDNNVQESDALEQLARNAYKEAKKQQKIAQKVQQQNTMLTKQLESYKKKGYTNPYTLKKAISQNPKLYDASCLDDLNVQMNVRDSKDILDDASKSQIKMKKKSQDPIAIEKEQNV